MDPDELKIDILDDSVNDILDKLFYQASDGKVIDYAWDAPQPACVNPLTTKEALDWGKSAMNVSFTRVAASPIRRGNKRVSALERFTQRGTAQPYYGYKSEPPKSRATAAEEPIGPLAKGIKSAGVLSALSKHKGEKPSHVWELLEGTWGVIPAVVKKNAEPDLTNTSRKDEIKFARSPSHMLFGFNSDSPSVTVGMGNYLSHNLDKPYMFDWHAMATTLRFIGEFAKRYIPSEYKPGTSIAFAPALCEARLLSSTEYAVMSPTITSPGPDADLALLTAKTFQEFTTGVSSVVTRNNLASSKKSIKVEIGVEMADKLLAAIADSGSVRRNKLPKNMFSSFPIKTNNDITAEVGSRFRKSVLSNMNKISDRWVPTWKSVHSIVWQMYFESNPKRATEIMAVIRLKDKIDEMNPVAMKSYATEIACLVPKSLGLTIYQLLNHMLCDTERALVEFVNMAREISNYEVCTIESNYTAMYITAVARSTSIDQVTKYIQRAYSAYSSRTQGATKLKDLIKDNEMSHDGLKRSFESFLHERSKYWCGFYASRVSESSKHLTALKNVARKYNAKGFFNLGKAIPKDRPFAMLDFGHKIKSMADLKATIAELKVTTIMYSFVSLAYEKSMTKVKDDLSAEVYLTPDRLCSVILASADNYARKRKTWGTNLCYDEEMWEITRDKITRCNRATDMLKLVDEFFDPIVPWATCYDATKSKFLISSKSITNMLRNKIGFGTVSEDVSVEEEKANMMKSNEQLELKFQTYNLYSILEEESESSSCESVEDDSRYNDYFDDSEGGKFAGTNKAYDTYEESLLGKAQSTHKRTFGTKGEETDNKVHKATTTEPAKLKKQSGYNTMDFSMLNNIMSVDRTKDTTTTLPIKMILIDKMPDRLKASVVDNYILHKLRGSDPDTHRSEIEKVDEIVSDFKLYVSNIGNDQAYNNEDHETEDNVDIC